MRAIDDAELLTPASRREWRAWLAANHATSPRIWLAVAKKGATITSLTYDDAVEEALCFGWIDSIEKRLDEQRVKCLFTRRKRGGTWSRSNKERIERLQAQGLIEPAGLAVIEAAKADGSWTALDAAEAMIVPDDLREALDAVPEAARHFEAFSDSVKKQTIWWVVSAKRVETRQRRIGETVRLATENRRITDPREPS